MFNALRKVSLRKTVDIVLVVCVCLITGIASLGWLSQKAADQQIEIINRVAVNQSDYAQTGNRQLLKAMLSGIAAVDALRNSKLSDSAGYLQDMNNDILRAEEFFSLFKQMPPLHSLTAQKVVHDFEAEFAQVLVSLHHGEALIKNGQLNEFNELRHEKLRIQLKKLGETMEVLFEHFNGTARSDMEHYLENLNFFTSVGILFLFISTFTLLGIRLGLYYLVVDPLAKAVRQLDGLAQADLTQTIDVTFQNEVGKLQDSMLRLKESLIGIVSNTRKASSEMLLCANQISSGNIDLATRTEQQGSSLEQTAASMEELTATIKQNAENAHQATSLAAQASDAATQGQIVINSVIDTMSEISNTAKKVTQIINLIDSIAFQTNILALNASVEAARAGEQGRGFAVVANEVRNLASRSADAACEIKSLINTSGQQIEQGASLVENAGKIMGDIVNSVKYVSDIYIEIASASQEQSQGIVQINSAILQLERVTSLNSDLVKSLMQDSGSLMLQADHLEKIVSIFKMKK